MSTKIINITANTTNANDVNYVSAITNNSINYGNTSCVSVLHGLAEFDFSNITCNNNHENTAYANDLYSFSGHGYWEKIYDEINKKDYFITIANIEKNM